MSQHETMLTVDTRRNEEPYGLPGSAREVRLVRHFDDRLAMSSSALDVFGGDTGMPAEAATGFFRVARKGERWWLRTPLGHRFIHMAVNSVAPGKRGGSLPPGVMRFAPQGEAAMKQRFGNDLCRWRDETLALLHEHHFNGTGAWSFDALHAQGSPRPVYTPMWNFMSQYGEQRGGTWQEPGHKAYPNRCIFVFDPQFASFCAEHARQLAALRHDPYLLGHFTDNEMPLPTDSLRRYLQLSSDDPGHRAALAWVAQQTGRSADESIITDALCEAWLGHVVDTYFDIVTRAIRQHDPNHLILGARFYGEEKNNPQVFAAAGKHLDVVSVNHYWCWTPGDEVAQWTRWSGRPSLISEWYARADDTGLPNRTGAGWTVRTQRDRGLFYQNFTLGLLQTRTCVGWHWFKYLDNDPTDINAEPSNRDSNKGIVTAAYQPHVPMLELAGELNRCAYAIADVMDGEHR